MSRSEHRARAFFSKLAPPQVWISWALLGVLTGAGCGGDESNPFVLIPYIPPTDQGDMAMSNDGGVVRPFDPYEEDRPRCESVAEACLLPGAVGACVNGRCRLVVCEEGRGDCDGDPTNGCEVDLTSTETCGSCFESCSELQTCQRSVTGFACSVGVVCEPGRFDLDALQETGCEIEARQLTDVTLPQPIALGMALTERVAFMPSPDVAIDSVSAFLGFIVGFDGEGRRVVQPPARGDGAFVSLPSSVMREPFSGNSLSLDLVVTSEGNVPATMFAALDVWQDAAYLYRTTPSETNGFMAYGPLDVRFLDAQSVACEEGASLSFQGGLIRQTTPPGEPRVELVTSSGMFALDPCADREDGLCLDGARGFHGVDYLRWFFPYEEEDMLDLPGAHAPAEHRLSAQEVEACQQCALDTGTGALRSARVCYVSNVASCGLESPDACEGVCESPAVGCPDFDLREVAFSAVSERHYVVTRRGVVVLRDDGQVWLPLARLESAWDASSVGGGGFIDVAITRSGDRERLFLLHSRGFVRVIDVSLDEPVKILPAHPDIPVLLGSLDGRGPLALEALDARTLLLVDPYQATMVYLQDNFDHGEAVIELEQDLSSGGFLGGQLVEDGVVLFKQEFGLTSVIFAGRR